MDIWIYYVYMDALGLKRKFAKHLGHISDPFVPAPTIINLIQPPWFENKL